LSTTSGALNVAGSIGGLANAIGNLASLITGDWFSNLKPASYGGVRFGVESLRTSAGRKTSIHSYPFRNEDWIEDLGKRNRRFEVMGFLVEQDLKTGGGSAISQRDALLAVCETAGGQTLVHPTLGTVTSVCCLGVEITERRDLGPVFEFRLTLQVTGSRIFPSTTVSSADAAKSAASLTGIAALANFVATTASQIAAGAAVAEQAVSTAVGWYQLATTAVNDVKAIIGAVSTLGGNFGRLFGGGNSGYAGSNAQAPASASASDLLSAATAARAAVATAGAAFQAAAGNPADSATLGAAAAALVAAVAAAATDPGDAVRMVSSMASYSPAPVTTPGEIGSAMGTMQVALAAYLRRAALVQLAQTLTKYQPTSQQDAAAVVASATTLFGNEITVAGDAGDDDTYQALIALQQAMMADLNARGADLASIATFQFSAPLPALTLANRIYRDSTREGQLVQQVSPIHPAFMPTTFQALSS
jgi:prophage DNA circulation protein